MNSPISFSRYVPGSTMSIVARFSRCLVAVALVCSFAASAHAGTAGVANGEFDSDLSGWDLSGTPFPIWGMLDLQGNPASGSAMLFNDDAQANARLYSLRQCVALSAPGTYAVEADGFLPAGHVGGRLVVSLSARAIADCSGGTNFSTGYFLQSNGGWVHGTANITLAPGYNYVQVLLGIEKDAGGGSLSGNIDAVHVINRDPLFSNGFEAPVLALPPT